MRTTAPSPLSLPPLAAALRDAGQEHLLKFWPELTPTQRETLERQIAAIDLASLPTLIQTYVTSKSTATNLGAIEPTPYYRTDGSNWDREHYRRIGVNLIAAGKVAAFTVAGGQGTRLGSDAPKGCYPAGAVSGKPLFACLAEWILAAQKRYCTGGKVIPWYIMTSPINHEPTVAFFEQHHYFGLRKADVMFFPQGVMPSFDHSGRILLDQKHQLALSPDGHGGSLKALATSGALSDMERRGIEQLSYTQIDNPLVRVIDPAFLGLHASAPDSSGEMSSKMVLKAGPDEKVGVLCRVDGRTSVVEYSDMPAVLSRATNTNGTLKFAAGSIAIHIISTAFIRRLTSGGVGGGLPFHRAEKKVPHIDLITGQRVEPTAPNAVKLEMFVFDALPMCERSIVLETDRLEEFAPIKNATGADSPETCRRIQTARAARWLEQSGINVPRSTSGEPECVIEMSPLSALEPSDLKGRRIEIERSGSAVL